ncbi:MAG: hypothetical protein V1921_08835 [Candidatus Altiarchaeota archaeon]
MRNTTTIVFPYFSRTYVKGSISRGMIGARCLGPNDEPPHHIHQEEIRVTKDSEIKAIDADSSFDLVNIRGRPNKERIRTGL